MIRCKPRSPIRDEFTGEALGQVGHRLALVNVAGHDPTCEPLAMVVDDEVELEAIKPAYGVFAASGELFEHLVAVDAAMVTDHLCGRNPRRRGRYSGRRGSGERHTVASRQGDQGP